MNLLLLASSLALSSAIGPAGVGAARSGRRVPAGKWVSPITGKEPDDVIAMLAARRVVLLGETHDEAEHHRWQLHTIEALFSHRPDMVLGFEMFPRRVQPVLDRWTSGELSEADFLREVDWAQIWGIAAGFYLPLFQFARRHRLPMLALNVDRATNRRIAAQGFDAVPRSERDDVGNPAPASSSYRDRLSGWFKMHPVAGGKARPEAEPFERFVRAQLFWDRAMAEAIASLERNAQWPLVVGIMGRGHIEYGDGVPHQLTDLGVEGVATALPWPADADYPLHEPPIADVLFGVAAST